jgi:hypothetical protein
MVRSSTLVVLAAFASSVLACSAETPSEEESAAFHMTAESQAASATDGPIVGGPANGACADATAELVYTISRHEGGARPPAGMIMGEQRLTYEGNPVGRTVIREGGASEPDDNLPWDVTLRFVDGTKHVLDATGNPRAGSETYAQKVKGTLVRGLGPSIAHNTFEAHVICTDHWNQLMP